MFSEELDHHLVSDEPMPMFMGELPRRYDEIPARVVVNLCGVYPGGEPFGRVVVAMAMLDALEPDLLPRRESFEQFLDAVHAFALREPTYWHCHAGINRSGMAVAGYLHRHRGMRISDAIESIRQRRTRMVLCNGLFERTLRLWYGEDDEQSFEPFSMEDYLVERVGRN